MVHHIAKRQKVDELEAGEEAVLFNSDTLSKIISYLPSIDLLNLALTNKKFGVSNNNVDPSLIDESTRIAIHEVATEEQLTALPHYEGESTLADYHYLQLLRKPLVFDQLVGAEYVNSGDKSCIRHSGEEFGRYETAFSINVLRTGKHYATFKHNGHNLFVGVMRSGQANQRACGIPCKKQFYQNFSQTHGDCNNDNNIHSCLYHSYSGDCFSSDWSGSDNEYESWEGSEKIYGEIGLLLDLDEGTLTVYKNGRKLGVMKRGLAGSYCWVVSMWRGSQVTIKRGTLPPPCKRVGMCAASFRDILNPDRG